MFWFVLNVLMPFKLLQRLAGNNVPQTHVYEGSSIYELKSVFQPVASVKGAICRN